MEDSQQLTQKLNNDPKTVPKVAKVENEIQLYGRRWLILAIFMSYTIAAGLHWMQYSIIANLVVKYYNVEAYEVEWTPMIHMLTYVMFILPALWFLEKFGNRISMIIASGGVCMGAWIKMFAARPDAWFFVICGQIVEATAQVMTFGLAGSVTATWFGHHEIALAGSLASFGDLFGAGIGFVFPTLFVNNGQSREEIGGGIYEMCLLLTIYTTAVFAVVVIFFQDHPKKPPSNAQIVRNEQKKQADPVGDFIKTIRKKSLLLILLTYGIHISIFDSHGTLLNRTFTYYFPNHEKDAGWVGCLIILSGMIGSLVGGYFLDRTHLFKETTYVFYICSTVCLTAYTMAFHFRSLILVYVFACMLGIFMFGYYATTLQLAYEVVHPYSEGTAAGLAICSVQLMGVLLTPLYREIFERFSPLTANLSLICLQIMGILLTFGIPAKYRRQQAEKLLKYGESAKEFIKEIENDTD